MFICSTMFFVLSKVLAFLISPLTWIFILLLFALFSRRTQRKRIFLLSSIVLLFIFSNGFLFSEAMRWLEPEAIELEEDEHYEYAIVLGGMAGYNHTLDRPIFFAATDRILQGLSLYKAGKVDKLLISGGSGRLINQEDKESLILKNYLVSIGFSPDDLIAESASRNTRENAVNTALLLEKLNASGNRNLLITSAFHMPRAKAAFRKVGLDVKPFPVDHYASPIRRFHPDHLLLPDAEILFNWYTLLHEIAGRIAYRLAGYT